jgi:glycosyltransferase involved in cell wall biosynthesis
MKVSTIIPAFDAVKTIAQAVDSALAQQCEGQEVVVVNDGSTDSTLSVLEGYGSRIHVINRSNSGAAAARNVGVANSSGEYLAFLDADDVWLPDKLATMLVALERNPGASMAFSEYGFIDNAGSEYGQSSIGVVSSMSDLMEQHPFPITSFNGFIFPSTWIVPRAIFERSGGFCETFKGAGFEDSWMLLQLRELGEFVYVPQKLCLYRGVPHPFEAADKYGAGIATFVALVKKRYGRRAKLLIRDVKSKQCRSLLSKSAFQMNSGDKLGALQTMMRIAKLSPSYFVGAEFRKRLLLPQNLKRVQELSAFTLSRTRR